MRIRHHSSCTMLRRVLLLVLITALLLTACGGDDDDGDGDTGDTVTVGVMSHAASLNPVVAGFRDGLAEQGYVEGENLVFLYDGPTGGTDALQPLFEELMEQDVDLLLTTGTPPTLVAQTGTDSVPIIFAPANDPIETGFVTSMTTPGGNLTGVRNSISTARALDWLLQIKPDVARLLVFHNPNDESSIQSLTELTAAASELGVELVVVEGTTGPEFAEMATNFPDDVDAVFLVRSGLITSQATAIVATATARGIPVATSLVGQLVEENGVLLGYGSDYYAVGKQAARVAAQVLGGEPAAETPVETAESFLHVNLVSAEAIGLTVPDQIVSQADMVVYPEASAE